MACTGRSNDPGRCGKCFKSWGIDETVVLISKRNKSGSFHRIVASLHLAFNPENPALVALVRFRRVSDHARRYFHTIAPEYSLDSSRSRAPNPFGRGQPGVTGSLSGIRAGSWMRYYLPFPMMWNSLKLDYKSMGFV